MLSRGSDDLEVVVVGAGAAGLGAALQLAAAKVSFTVFEAPDIVLGGRWQPCHIIAIAIALHG
jgi:cation diffusion facilitator CzcD-associated flavoprotein CzcO